MLIVPEGGSDKKDKFWAKNVLIVSITMKKRKNKGKMNLNALLTRFLIKNNTIQIII
jgi:hypothetical protein